MSAKSKLLKIAASSAITTREELTAIVITTADTILTRDKLTLERESIDKNQKRIHTWAVSNRKEYFGTSRTFAVAGHTLEFRQSPGKVETTKGTTQNDVINALLGEDDEIQEKYLSVKAALDKHAILKAFDPDKGNPEDRTKLENLGLTISAPDLFTFKPNQSTVQS
jgi:hypothetical protein